MKKLLHKFWGWAKPYFTWKMVPFLAIAWVITNGWSYAFVLVGTRYGIGWMTWLGGIWMSFLWFPLTIEKPITIFLAGLLYRIVYRESFIPKIEGEENAL
jgi:hypothetical protein